MDYTDCNSFVAFSSYDWTFERKGHLKWNPTAFCLIASFCAVAYWMSIELLVLVYVTFKRHTGLYFWSIVITTLGFILQTTGYLVKEFAYSSPPILTTIICKVGWVSNVTGFSIVLWSRLHLVVNDPRILRAVLIMIVVNGVLMHSPIVVFEFGLISRHKQDYMRPMEIMERVQQTVFTLQEAIISCLYIFYTRRFLNSGYAMHTRKVVRLLVLVQACVIAFDGGLTAFDYKNMFTLKCTIHPFVYALKLKLEFIVLNQLLALIKNGLNAQPGPRMGLFTDSDDSSLEKENSNGDSLPNITLNEAERRKVANTFITKSPIASGQAKPFDSNPAVPKVRVGSAAMIKFPNETRREARKDTSNDEQDLKHVIGRPDDETEVSNKTQTVISDLQRQYLGRYPSEERE
ncbi:Nn.00g089060.m01.CDS01 [Neocucurbitaria sp. VM-36]